MTYDQYCALQEGDRVRLLRTTKSKYGCGIDVGSLGQVVARVPLLGEVSHGVAHDGMVWVAFDQRPTRPFGCPAVFLDYLGPAPDPYTEQLLAAFSGGTHG